MKEQHRQIIRFAAVGDIIIALVLLAMIFIAGFSIPLLVPAVLALSGVLLIVVSIVLK